jgi:hypothetical protein
MTAQVREHIRRERSAIMLERILIPHVEYCSVCFIPVDRQGRRGSPLCGKGECNSRHRSVS